MRSVGLYSLAALATVLVGGGVAWPLLDDAGRRGLLEAAVVALAVQVPAFAVLARTRGRATGFLAAFAGGMAIRLAVVAVVGLLAIRFEARARTVTLVLGLVSFLFVLVLLEAWFLAARSNRNNRNNRNERAP